MKFLKIQNTIPLLLLILAGTMLVWWFCSQPMTFEKRVPGRDQKPQADDLGNQTPLTGKLETFDGAASNLTGSWPRFRGSRFDAIAVEESTELADSWQTGQPAKLWEVEVGEGYAGAAIHAGRVYLLDYDREQAADVLRCLSLDDGRNIWNYSYPVKVKRNHGMSRTVPAVTDMYVVSLGPKCHVTCLNAQTGEHFWSKDLVKEFGCEVPLWYAGQCPLIENDRAILAPGGEALMMAVDCASGEVLWKSPNPHDWKMTHSSIMPMEFMDQRMYVYCGSGGVVGISAEDGAVLWETTDWKIRIATVASPVILDEGRIFLSGGYNAGSKMFQLIKDGDGFGVATLFTLKPEIFGAAQHTPIFYENYLYGVRPDEQLVCLNTDGEVLWVSGSDHQFGIGPYMIANGLIYVMNDEGRLTLVKADPSGYQQLGEAQVLTGHDSWGPMALAAGRLIVRDLTKMVCLGICRP